MKGTCPVCGFYGGLEGFVALDEYKEALAVMHTLPQEFPRQVLRYLGLFRKPGGAKAMTGPRALKIVRELKDLVTAPEIQWKGKRILPNRPGYWAQALAVVFDKDDAGSLERPLDKHNLLRAIAYDLADKNAEAELREKEQSRGRVVYEQPQQGGQALDQEENKDKARSLEGARIQIKNWRDKLGG